MVWYPDALVIGPGGTKGLLYMGGLLTLENEDLLKNIHTIVGVSVGSIIGLLLCVNVKVKDMINMSLTTDIFNGVDMASIVEIPKRLGLTSNTHLKIKLEDIIKSKYGYVPNLKELYTFTGIRFVSVCCSIDNMEIEYMDYITEPSISCVDAVLLSGNIPGFFHVINYRTKTYIDGAFGDPMPLFLVDDGKNQVLSMTINNYTLTKFESPQKSPAMYFYRTYTFPVNQLIKISKRNCSSKVRHIVFEYEDTDDVFGIDLREKGKLQMVIIGAQTVKKFLEEKSSFVTINSEDFKALQNLI
jgi:predicted acylesterase/phospholipase RssA